MQDDALPRSEQHRLWILSMVGGIVLARILTREAIYDTMAASPGRFLPWAVFCGMSALTLGWAVLTQSQSQRLPATLLWAVALAVVTWCSVAWATNPFQTVIAAGNTTSAVALAVATWLSWPNGQASRWVWGVVAGVLLALCAQSALYLAIDQPALARWWETHRQEELAAMGISGEVGGAFLYDGRVASKQCFSS